LLFDELIQSVPDFIFLSDDYARTNGRRNAGAVEVILDLDGGQRDRALDFLFAHYSKSSRRQGFNVHLRATSGFFAYFYRAR